MPHSFGYRARTRDMFARDFGKNGVNELSIYMRKYKVCVCVCGVCLAY